MFVIKCKLLSVIQNTFNPFKFNANKIFTLTLGLKLINRLVNK